MRTRRNRRPPTTGNQSAISALFSLSFPLPNTHHRHFGSMGGSAFQSNWHGLFAYIPGLEVFFFLSSFVLLFGRRALAVDHESVTRLPDPTGAPFQRLARGYRTKKGFFSPRRSILSGGFRKWAACSGVHGGIYIVFPLLGGNGSVVFSPWNAPVVRLPIVECRSDSAIKIVNKAKGWNRTG